MGSPVDSPVHGLGFVPTEAAFDGPPQTFYGQPRPKRACMRLMATVWLVGFLLLAGCTGTPREQPHDDVDVPALTAAEPAFDGPFLAGTYENGEKESFVAVSPDGQTVLSCAHGEFRHSAYMYASEDRGVTWRTLTANPDPAVSGDCEVAVSSSGVWAFLHSTVAGATIATTADKGATWRVNLASGIPIGGMADRPFLEYLGERLLISMQPGPLQPGGIGFAYSDDHGATWSTPVIVARGEEDRTHVNNGGFVLGPDGTTIRIPVSQSIEAASDLTNRPGKALFAISRDRGETWTTQTVSAPGGTGYFPAAAQDQTGTLYWVYPRTIELADHLFVTLSTDDGVTWSEPRQLEGSTIWSRPWAHGRADGSMDILWQREAEQVPGELVVTRVQANGTLLDETVLGPLQEFLEYAEITHDATGRGFIAASVPGETAGRVEAYVEAAGPS